MRQHKIVVRKDGEVAYCLGFHKNMPSNVDMYKPTVQMSLSNYWHYTLEDEGLDWRYVDRFELFVFDRIEEYSWLCTKVILRHNPAVRIAFTDASAALFFAADERVAVAASEEELFAEHPELRELRALHCFGEIRWSLADFFAGRVPSILLLTSMYWIRREFSYGCRNPDKTFFLIKQPVKENGITAVVSNVIGGARMLEGVRPDFIPVVDLAISTDTNQFAGTSGRDVWGMFFKELSPYSLEEVYDSQHVILDQNSNVNMNPFFTEFLYTNARAEVKYRGLLHYRDDVQEFIDEALADILPSDGSRVLGVVACGTDYTAEKYAPFVPKGIPSMSSWTRCDGWWTNRASTMSI